MGNLVFQAALGGQVNFVGPNTASTFNLNVPAVAGTLVTTGDTGTVTSTMLASSVYTTPGTIGSGTPNTGAFTTLSATTSVTSPIVGAGSGSNLSLQSNATTQATLDTSGNLGLGTTSPNARLTAIGAATINGATNVSARFTDNSNSAILISHPASAGGTATLVGITQIGFATSDSTTTTERARIDTSGQMFTTDVAGNVKVAYDCRAYMKFSVSGGSPSVTASGNVSSISDNGVGDFTMNFSTAMSDANYSAVGTPSSGSTANMFTINTHTTAPTSSAYRFWVMVKVSGSNANNTSDASGSYNSVSVFR